MNTIKEILFGKLRPWNGNEQSNDYYQSENRLLSEVQPTYNPQFNLQFIRFFSSKTQYYQKLINNDIVDYCNKLFSDCENISDNLIAYKLLESERFLYSKIKQIWNVIKTQQFDITTIQKSNVDFSIDKSYKESTFILFYLLSAMIKCCLEVQEHFENSINEADFKDIPDYYTELLQIQVPEETYISKVVQIEIKPQPIELDNKNTDFKVQIIQDNYTQFMEAVQLYQFAELPKFKALTPNNQRHLVTKLVGEKTPYAVAMLNFLEYPLWLKSKYSLNKEQQYKHIANAIKSAVRVVKGNFLVLNPESKEDSTIYTAIQYTKNVEKDYLSYCGN